MTLSAHTRQAASGRRGRLWAAALGAALWWGCGAAPPRPTPPHADGPPLAKPPPGAGEPSNLRADAEAAWKDRSQESRLLEAIDAWKRTVRSAPADSEAWARLSRAYYFWADGHIRFRQGPDSETKRAMLDAFREGVAAADRALGAVSPAFAARLQRGDSFEQAAEALDARAVPALYWRAANLGRWASTKGFATLLSYKDEVRASMQQCAEQDPSFHYHGPDRYFGAFYANVPRYAGGDLSLSRRHFETAIEAAPDFLPTRVLMAEGLAVAAGDRPLFEAQLDVVLSKDPGALTNAAPENRVAQRKARLLRQRADALFE